MHKFNKMKSIVILIGSFLHITNSADELNEEKESRESKEGKQARRNVNINDSRSKAFNLANSFPKRIRVYDLSKDLSELEREQLEDSIMLADLLIVFDDDLKSPGIDELNLPAIINLITPRVRSGDGITVLVSNGPNTHEMIEIYSEKVVKRQEDMQSLAWEIKEFLSEVNAE